MEGVAYNRPQALSERCLPEFDWLDNDIGQSPCEVARILIDECSAQDFYSLAALDLVHGQTHYPSPNPMQGSSCQCSMGVYNLVQACAACQQDWDYEATPWGDWVANCTVSNVNSGLTFPYDCPGGTEIPDWAYANNAGGALIVGEVYRHAAHNQSSSSAPPSSTSSPASTSTSETQYTEYSAKQTMSNIDSGAGEVRDKDEDSGSKIGMIVGVAVPVVLAAFLAGALFAYLRRKKRKSRQRGQRLDSSSEVHDSASSTLYSDGVMKQKEAGFSAFAAPVRSTSSYTRGSGRSFTTNSVSTGVPIDAYRRESTFYSPSTGFDTMTRSSEFTYEDSVDARDESTDIDDESISPFSDIHRPAPSRVNTRNNIHTSPSFSHQSFSSFSLSPSTHTPSVRSRDDAASLLTTASSRAAPSSSGATYGGVHDDYDDNETETDGASFVTRSDAASWMSGRSRRR
ncbi:uncharacterized protein JCM10292_006325 [Rhodotorula paludigena]|uniref:uncharacterized protein n=1 Tax=Rhodotorula paludigena TaxID=86838 RepID=UPI00317C334A